MSDADALPNEQVVGDLTLRAPDPGDRDAIFEAITESIEALMPWLGWLHPDYALFEVEEWIARALAGRANRESVEYVLWRGGRVVGACGLNKIVHDFRKANLGYWVRTAEVGHGIATRATRAVASLGFRHLALERIEIVADVANRASQRVAEKAGATREGVIRNGIRVRTTQVDAVMYSLIPSDLSHADG